MEEKQYLKKIKELENDNTIELLTVLMSKINTRGSLEILYILDYVNDGVKYSDIQRLTDISFGALNPTLQKFIKLKYVVKNEYTRLYSITEMGKKLLKNININGDEK